MSTTKTFYPNTLSQTTGIPYMQFSGLANLKNSSSTYATSKTIIAGKNGTYKRPSTITATNFKISLPEGAEISSIKVEYRQQKTPYGANAYPNIPAPTISLLNVSASAVYGAAPTATLTNRSVTFNVKPAANKVTSSSFGVRINYPQNQNTNPGYLRLQYIRVVITYNTPSFAFTLTKDGVNHFEGSVLNINATINNSNNTSYNPSVRIDLPGTVTFQNYMGDGSITSNGNVLTWDPQISSSTKSRNVQITISLDSISEDNLVKISESTTQATQTMSFDIVENPSSQVDEEVDDEEIIGAVHFQVLNMTLNEPYYLTVHFEDIDTLPSGSNLCEINMTNFAWLHTNLCWKPPSSDSYNVSPTSYDIDGSHDFLTKGEFNANGNAYLRFTPDAVFSDGPTVTDDEYSGNFYIKNKHTNEIWWFEIRVKPKQTDLTAPYFSVLRLDEEEVHRLGNGYTYVMQSFLKVMTNETYVRDWYKNFRIGIFNNPIYQNITKNTRINENGETEDVIYDSTDYTNLSDAEIFNNAEYWSGCPKEPNKYENLTCEFVYNDSYPLHIIISGDYTESDTIATINFTEPCIIESDKYKGRETNGNYPVPINSSIVSSSNPAELVVNQFETSTGIVMYDLPVGETFNAENIVIKGISVDFDIEYTDMLSVNIVLRSPTGETGERTIITDPLSNHVTIGDTTDRWGFEASKLTEIEDWEIILYVNNVFGGGDSTILFNNLQVTFHSSIIDDNVVKVFVDGENIAAYGAFIQDVVVPAGIETETKSLNIDGTDRNDIYRQNIKEKTIEITFTIDGCSIEESTQLLQEITALLVNKRNKLNMPIPKRLELSHYPGLYWEYVIEDALDTKSDSGNYEVKAKLVIPTGTAFATNQIITNNVGRVGGIAKINPLITLIPTSNSIMLLESISGQKFTMSYSNWDSTCTVEIDCEERTVYLRKPTFDNLVDISSYVDWDVDWFILHGEYDFNTTGCILQSVTRTERR